MDEQRVIGFECYKFVHHSELALILIWNLNEIELFLNVCSIILRQ